MKIKLSKNTSVHYYIHLYFATTGSNTIVLSIISISMK